MSAHAAAVLFALLSALANATASVLQRRAARGQDTTGGFGLRLVLVLVRRPLWLGGVAAMVASGIFQAVALALGGLALVQPVLVTELLFTLLVGSAVFRRRPGGRTWTSFLVLAGGLAAFLALTAPSPGRRSPLPGEWLLTGTPALAVVVGLGLAARRCRSTARAALLGAATAICFSFTAALMKDAAGRWPGGAAAVLGSWQIYATLLVGAVSAVLLQHALRAGSLVASQPALTLADALLSVVLGAVLFDEQPRTGGWLVPEACALALIVAGSVELARSPLVSGRPLMDQ